MPKDRKLIPTIIAAAIFIILEVAALNMLRNNSALQGIWVSKGAHKVMSVLWGGSESIKYYFCTHPVQITDIFKKISSIREYVVITFFQ